MSSERRRAPRRREGREARMRKRASRIQEPESRRGRRGGLFSRSSILSSVFWILPSPGLGPGGGQADESYPCCLRHSRLLLRRGASAPEGRAREDAATERCRPREHDRHRGGVWNGDADFALRARDRTTADREDPRGQDPLGRGGADDERPGAAGLGNPGAGVVLHPYAADRAGAETRERGTV